MKRRVFLAGSASAALAACSQIGTKLNENPGFHGVLQSVERLNQGVIGTRGRVREYSAADISSDFPIDSLPTPTDSAYGRMARDGFRSFRLPVTGAVERPQAFTLAQLQHMMDVSQITRHDCVEGWSAISQWQGVRLADVLALVRPAQRARFVIFHSYDVDSQGTPYYESLSLQQAAHPQTLLSLRQNGKPLEIDRGAPVRLTVPTQLGYKSAKWLRSIEVADSMSALYGGEGGYWEDQGYEWYAGI